MAYLNGLRFSSRARTVRPKVLGFVVLAGALSVSRALLQAAPVTLQFEATVGSPRQGADAPLPPNWNIDLQQGDTITGTFTFEPFDAASNTTKTTLVQPFDFSIHIKNRTLTTSQYGVEVFNNYISDDVPEPVDTILVGCPLLLNQAVCTPGTVSPTDPVEWSFQLALWGDPSVLDGADIPADPIAWQQLIFEDSMGVTLIDDDARRFYGFLASPTSFQAVPEPGTFMSALLGTLVIVLARHCFQTCLPLICNRR
jgi:hypothetical protein